ncbi:LysR family transcriptional regulator [Adlercreutzia sp. ZJ138]|uniref:LysR family transcriptional regulator n=1 Tax=Adlercreutzia sp. ZJ138 TaxID=2709405 RepID=UPI0013ECA444|nr:LysR family transcriptional regulator [Adlercreutzia sp. ZJ138]
MDTNIQKYLAFAETVRYGSFTKAAEILSYSQSGISRMISDLESEWKVTLLERDRSGVRLTSDGEELLPYVLSVCEEHRKLQMQVDDLNGLHTGLVRIGTMSSIATHWFPQVIKRFQEEYPRVRFEFVVGDYEELEDKVEQGRVECAISRESTRPGLTSEFLQEDELKVLLPRGHRLTSRSRVPINELRDELFALTEKGDQALYKKAFDEAGFTPNTLVTTWDDLSMMSMVESGLCVGIQPDLVLRRMPYDIVIRPLENPVFRNICLVKRQKQTLSLATKRFLDYLNDVRSYDGAHGGPAQCH